MAPRFWQGLKIGLLLGLCTLAAAFMLRPTPPAQHKPKRIPVRFWHMWTAEWAQVVDDIAQRFNQSQDKYEVIPLSVPSAGADTKFLLAVAGGNPPDVMAQWNAVIPTWAQNRVIQPLDRFMTPEEKRRFDAEAYPVVKRLGYYRDHLYAITIGMNLSACYYQMADFAKAGVKEPPETLEGLVAIGEKLNKIDPEGNYQRLGYLTGSLSSTAPLFGGGFYDWQKNEVTLNTPANLKALEFLVRQRKKIGFEKLVRFQSGLDEASFTGGWPFIDDAYSITMDGQWRVEQMRKYAPQVRYGTFVQPPPKGGVARAGYSSGNFMIIPEGAKHAEGAWEFIKFWSGLGDPETAAEFYTWGGWLPLSPAIANASKYQAYLREFPQFKTFVDMMPSPNIQTRPPVAYQVFLMDRVGKYEDMALRGTLSPKEALRQLQSDVDNERKRRKELGFEE